MALTEVVGGDAVARLRVPQAHLVVQTAAGEHSGDLRVVAHLGQAPGRRGWGDGGLGFRATGGGEDEEREREREVGMNE